MTKDRVYISFFFTMALCTGLIHITSAQGCEMCFSDFCGSMGGSRCRLTFINSGTNTEGYCAGPSSCFQENTIVDCSSISDPKVYSLFMDRITICAETDRLDVDERSRTEIDPGFYIINQYRICEERCIDRIFVRADESQSSSIEFSLYKRYEAQSGSSNELFVRRLAFNTILNYNTSLRSFEAVPTTLVDVKMGEYIGMDSDLTITGTRKRLSTHGIWTNINRLQTCSENVFNVDTSTLTGRVPLISVQLLPCDSFTSKNTVPPGSSTTISRTRGTVRVSPATTSTDSMQQTTGLKATTNTTDAIPSKASSSNLPLIGGSAGVGLVVIIVIVLTVCIKRRIPVDANPQDIPVETSETLTTTNASTITVSVDVRSVYSQDLPLETSESNATTSPSTSTVSVDASQAYASTAQEEENESTVTMDANPADDPTTDLDLEDIPVEKKESYATNVNATPSYASTTEDNIPVEKNESYATTVTVNINANPSYASTPEDIPLEKNESFATTITMNASPSATQDMETNQSYSTIPSIDSEMEWKQNSID